MTNRIGEILSRSKSTNPEILAAKLSGTLAKEGEINQQNNSINSMISEVIAWRLKTQMGKSTQPAVNDAFDQIIAATIKDRPGSKFNEEEERQKERWREQARATNCNQYKEWWSDQFYNKVLPGLQEYIECLRNRPNQCYNQREAYLRTLPNLATFAGEMKYYCE